MNWKNCMRSKNFKISMFFSPRKEVTSREIRGGTFIYLKVRRLKRTGLHVVWWWKIFKHNVTGIGLRFKRILTLVLKFKQIFIDADFQLYDLEGLAKFQCCFLFAIGLSEYFCSVAHSNTIRRKTILFSHSRTLTA